MSHYNHQSKIYATDHNAIISVIRTEISSQPLGNERITVIQDGICFMLSINWIECLITGKSIFYDLCDAIDHNTPLTTDQKKYLEQIGNNFCTYAENIVHTIPDFPATGIFDIYYPATIANVHNFFTTNCISKNAALISTANPIPTTAAIFANYFQDIATRYSRSFHLLTLSSATEGHSVAIYQTSTNLYFFDCNYGEYTITNLEKLFTELNTAYTDLTLSGIYSYTF